MNLQNLHYSGALGFGVATTLFASILLLMALVPLSATSVSMYESCKPVSCRKGPNITYPFYMMDHQDESCGYPNFGVKCQGDNPIYTSVRGDSYIIRDISDYGTSARFVNSATLNDSCPFPVLNSSFFDGNLMKVEAAEGSVISNLCFFYGCNFSSNSSSPPPKKATKIGCRSEARGIKSFVELADWCNKTLNWSRHCSSVVKASVEVNKKQLSNLNQSTEAVDEIEYEELLKGGFTLRMTWTEDACKKCQTSGGRCGYNTTETRSVCHCSDRTHLLHCGKDKDTGNEDNHLEIGLGVGIGGLAVIVLILSIYMICHRRIYKATLSQNGSPEDSFGHSNIYFEVPIFSNDELEEATNNFDSSKELGDGGYGTVYYGKLRDGREVAVKRLYEHNYSRVKQFMTEVQILTRLHHKNLVSLYGCTSRRSRELLLVYEYVPNGTVADHLHGDRTKPGSVPWPVRMNIAVETAAALAYLHKSGIIHRDVKTTNILLDNNFSVKVGDFGLSRLRPTDVTHVSTAPQGTPGYVDPEFHQCYQLTEKSDVYSFGVVLVELVSSMPAVDIYRDRHEINLANLAVNKIQKSAFDELIDPNLNFESDNETKRLITGVVELSFRCLQQDREMRPTMDEVVEELNAIGNGVTESGEPIDWRNNVAVDNEGKAKSMRFSKSPESDEAGLLKKVKFSSSPISVMQNWNSSSSSTLS